MVVVDRLTKYTHFRALSHPYKEILIIATFMETLYNLHGNLKIIVSDTNPIFTCNLLD